MASEVGNQVVALLNLSAGKFPLMSRVAQLLLKRSLILCQHDGGDGNGMVASAMPPNSVRVYPKTQKQQNPGGIRQPHMTPGRPVCNCREARWHTGKFRDIFSLLRSKSLLLHQSLKKSSLGAFFRPARSRIHLLLLESSDGGNRLVDHRLVLSQHLPARFTNRQMPLELVLLLLSQLAGSRNRAEFQKFVMGFGSRQCRGLLGGTEPSTTRLDCPTICHQKAAFSSAPDRESSGV